jgi:hypothetical protein
MVVLAAAASSLVVKELIRLPIGMIIIASFFAKPMLP